MVLFCLADHSSKHIVNQNLFNCCLYIKCQVHDYVTLVRANVVGKNRISHLTEKMSPMSGLILVIQGFGSHPEDLLSV